MAAFKEGRYLTDIVMGLSGNVYLFRNANAFHSLADIPTYKSAVPDATKQKDHIAAATRSRYWCMSYNTKRVKKSDLPKTWDDLVNCHKQPKWSETIAQSDPKGTKRVPKRATGPPKTPSGEQGRKGNEKGAFSTQIWLTFMIENP